MQRVTIVRYTTRPDRAEENVALGRAVFAELGLVAPADVAYALFRSGDDFLHLFVNLKEDSADAVTELPSFKAHTAGVAERCVAPPQPERLLMELVESYGFGT